MRVRVAPTLAPLARSWTWRTPPGATARHDHPPGTSCGAPPAYPSETPHPIPPSSDSMSDTSQSVIDRLPSLPTRPRCDECGARMEAATVWHPTAFEHVEAWACSDDGCGYREVRADDHF